MSLLRTLKTTGLSALETAVVKATFDDEDAPKWKHVKVLIDWSLGRMKAEGGDVCKAVDRVGSLLVLLDKRLRGVVSWKQALKTLIVLHQLMREGYASLMSRAGTASLLATASVYMDKTSSSASTATSGVRDITSLSKFIRHYADYLSAKSSAFQKLGHSVERQKTASSSKAEDTGIDSDTLGERIPVWLDQVSKLSVCRVPQRTSYSFRSAESGPKMPVLVRESLFLLVKDSLRVYPSAQLSLWKMICKFESLSLAQVKWLCRTCERYFTLTEAFEKWFTVECLSASIVSRSFAPKFDVLSPALVAKLTEYIAEKEVAIGDDNDDDDDDSVDDSGSVERKWKHSSKKGKKMKKKAKKKKKKSKKKSTIIAASKTKTTSGGVVVVDGGIGDTIPMATLDGLFDASEMRQFEEGIKTITDATTADSFFDEMLGPGISAMASSSAGDGHSAVATTATTVTTTTTTASKVVESGKGDFDDFDFSGSGDFDFLTGASTTAAAVPIAAVSSAAPTTTVPMQRAGFGGVGMTMPVSMTAATPPVGYGYAVATHTTMAPPMASTTTAAAPSDDWWNTPSAAVATGASESGTTSLSGKTVKSKAKPKSPDTSDPFDQFVSFDMS